MSAALDAPVEVFALIGADGEILYLDRGESAVAIADSRARWEAIWERRDALALLAHTHPRGPLAFSAEDDTTMQALAVALGRELVFVLVAPNGVLRRVQPATGEPPTAPDEPVLPEPAWAEELRRKSNMFSA